MTKYYIASKSDPVIIYRSIYACIYMYKYIFQHECISKTMLVLKKQMQNDFAG